MRQAYKLTIYYFDLKRKSRQTIEHHMSYDACHQVVDSYRPNLIDYKIEPVQSLPYAVLEALPKESIKARP